MNFHNLKSLFFLSIFVLLILPFSAISSDSFIKLIDQIRKENQVSAALVIIVDNDKVISQSYLGTGSWESDMPFNHSNMFRIGSISKSFAAILAMKMQQAGIIDLTKPLNYYLKKKYIENNFNTEITLEQLLEHTAGLPELSRAEWNYNKSQSISIDQAMDLKLGNHVSQWQPGMHSSYSNVGAGYLGLALEKASGKKYEHLMHEYVFKPLGMPSSTLFLDKYVSESLIKGYNTDGKTPIPYWHNIYRPFAAINTDTKDMVNFLQLMLNNGMHNKKQFLSTDDITRIETPKTTLAGKSKLTYGYGLGNYQWQTNGYHFYGHGGDADGYLSRYGYNKESGLAFYVMINAFQHGTLKQMRNVIENHITKDLPKPNYPLRLKLSDKELAKNIGKYKKLTNSFKKRSQPNAVAFEIINHDGVLAIQYNTGFKQSIYAVNNTHFRYVDESVATMAFITHEGKTYFQGESGNYVKIQ